MADLELTSDDLTLDEVRDMLGPLLPAHAAFDGWNDAALASAAAEAKIDGAIAALAFQDGAVAMIDAWFRAVDREMEARLPADALAALKIRARITELVAARIAIVAPHREALRRALAVLAMPQNMARAARMGWRAADLMWRLAGDTATDFNHYTKRLTLGAVYGSTIAVFLDDDSEGHVDTRAFLDRRIDNVMQFEKVKADWRARTEHRPSLSRFIGRLRYPAR